MSVELRVEARAGVALIVSTEAQPLLRQAKVEAAVVQLYARYADEPVGTERYLGAVMPGGTLTREYNPERDRDLVIAKISHSIEGVSDVAQMLDAESVLLPINRMTAPELNQLTDADHTHVSLGIKHHLNAKMLKVEVSTNADLGDAEVSFREVPAGGIAALPLTRTSPGTGALTLYVRVSATAGSRYGPPSAIQSVTFANLSGTGGSAGSGGYPPGAILPVEHAE